MKNIKKEIKKSYQEAYNHSSDIDSIKDKLSLKQTKPNFFTKYRSKLIFASCTLLVLLTSLVITLSVTTKGTNNPDDNTNNNYYTYTTSVITLELNPKISLSVDNHGNVESIYGENNEGKMLILNEIDNLIGKSYQYVVEKIVELEAECGYFVKNTLNENYNNLKITINNLEENQKELTLLENNLKEKITKKLNDLNVNISNKITIIKETKKQALIDKLLTLDPTLKEINLIDKTNKELLELITIYYLEVSTLPTTELEQMYNEFKLHEINVIENEIFKNILTSSTKINQEVINHYNFLYQEVNENLTLLKQTYSDYFIKEDSDYQKLYQEIIKAKQEVLLLRSEVEALEEGTLKTLKLGILQTKELTLTSLISSLELTKNTCITTIDLISKTINSQLEAIRSYILSNEELNTLMNEQKDQINQALNEQKANLIKTFEANYLDDFRYACKVLNNQRQTLIDQLKKENNE